MANLREFKFFIEEAGKRMPISIIIAKPAKSSDAEDYSCIVRAPQLFKSEKKIYGEDASQASELAIGFVKSLLSNRQLIDEFGNSVDLKDIQ